jgi:hypothetical protein
MLKSNKPQILQSKPKPKQISPQFIKKRLSSKKTSAQLPSLPLLYHQPPAVTTTTTSTATAAAPIPTNKQRGGGGQALSSNVIDADSISLASLSESPPSEFKFSDDDQELDEAPEENASFLNDMAAIQAQVMMSKQGAQLVDYSKSIQLQQQKLAHFNETRQRKKLFHNVLLNDQKLNNLKVLKNDKFLIKKIFEFQSQINI